MSEEVVAVELLHLNRSLEILAEQEDMTYRALKRIVLTNMTFLKRGKQNYKGDLLNSRKYNNDYYSKNKEKINNRRKANKNRKEAFTSTVVLRRYEGFPMIGGKNV